MGEDRQVRGRTERGGFRRECIMVINHIVP